MTTSTQTQPQKGTPTTPSERGRPIDRLRWFTRFDPFGTPRRRST